MASGKLRRFRNWGRVEARRECARASCYAFRVEQGAASPEYLFYDGHCGLCHRAVKFVLKHDRSGAAFRFAALQGGTFRERVAAERRAGLPDSMVVLTSGGGLLVRSDAFLHILRQLGGGWRVLAAALRVIPRGLRDFVYNFVARIRYRVFGRPEDVCPIVPPELRARFDP
ncbi:MAG: DCC1-like thiol-disulfide oxidoreductase family protein [Candidatus Acidiferrales bacterium]